MSETVHYKGTLTPFEKLEGEALEALCKRVLGNVELPSYCDSYQEMLENEGYKKFIIHADNVYSVEIKDIDPEADIFRATKAENGTIEYEVRYYNGGCGFSEAIETALKELT